MRKHFSWISIFALLGLLSSCFKTNNSVTDVVSQYNKDTTTISAYVTQNGIKASKLSQGIWLVVDSAAKGIRTAYDDTVSLKYSMKLLANNAVVDQPTAPVSFTLSSLISGIQIAMPQFQAGSKGRIFVPSYYGYGSTGQGSVPANANLVFGFTLMSVKDFHLKSDTSAIDAYLKTNAIVAVKDISGLRYTVDVIGTGAIPSITDNVVVTYKEKTFDGTITSQGTSVQGGVSGFILGFQIGLTKVPEGSTVTLYVPSSLGYGTVGSSSGTVKPNTNIIYTIQLTKVIH